MLLDYEHYLKIAYFQFYNYGYAYLQICSKEIPKDEFLVERVKAFYRVRITNKTNKRVEDGILLHLPNRLVSISLESNEGKFEIKKKVGKSNVVALRDYSSIYI